MTVKELMAKLAECNPNATIMLYCRDAEESDFANRVVETTLGDLKGRWYVKGDWADCGHEAGPAVIIG